MAARKVKSEARMAEMVAKYADSKSGSDSDSELARAVSMPACAPFEPELEWATRRAEMEAIQVEALEAKLPAWKGQMEVAGKALTNAEIAMERAHETGQVLRGHSSQVRCVVWSPNGLRLATASQDKTAAVWNTVTGEQLRVLKGHTYQVHAVAWGPDSRQLATLSRGMTAVWDAETGELMHELRHQASESCVAWSPDGRQLATALSDQTLVWDAKSGKLLYGLRKRTDGVMMCVAWSPDARRLATGCNTMAVVWDAATGQRLHVLEGHKYQVHSVAWSSDGRQLATGSRDATAVWDTETGTRMHMVSWHPQRMMMSIAWSPDGRRVSIVYSAMSECVGLALLDAATGQWLHVLQGHSSGSHPMDVMALNGVKFITWSPDGRQLAMASLDNKVAVWHAATGERLGVLKGHTRPVTSVAWSPDARELATSSKDSTVRIYCLHSALQLLDIEVSALFQCHCSPHAHDRARHEPHNERNCFSTQEKEAIVRWLQAHDADFMGVDLEWLRTHMQQQAIEQLLDTLQAERFLLFSNDGDSMLYVSRAFVASQAQANARSASNLDASQGTCSPASVRRNLASHPAAAAGGHNTTQSLSEVADGVVKVEVAQAGTEPPGDLSKACCIRHLVTGTFQVAPGIVLSVTQKTEFGDYRLQYYKHSEVSLHGSQMNWELCVDITLAICSSDDAQPRMRIVLNTLETKLFALQTKSCTSGVPSSDGWFRSLLPRSLRSSKGGFVPIIYHAEIGLALHRVGSELDIPLGVHAFGMSPTTDKVKQACAYKVPHGWTHPSGSLALGLTELVLPTPGQLCTIVSGPSVGTSVEVLEFAARAELLRACEANIKFERQENEAYVDFFTTATPAQGFNQAVDLLIQLHVEGGFWKSHQIKTAGRKTPLTLGRATLYEAVLDTAQPETVLSTRLRVQPPHDTDRPCRFQHSV
eukprot:jgi/Chlat1/8746/Chrsp9S08580